MYYNKSKIAILLATYKGCKYLKQQINSILKQTNQEWVVFYHDDGSNDGTLEILKGYTKLYPDKFCMVEGDSTGSAKDNFMFLTKMVDSELYMYH